MEREALKPVGGTREAFEKWAKTFPNYIDITRFENGYSDSDTNYAWVAWQAALAQPAQELAIGDIRALKHRIHELEGEVIGYKRILDAQPAQEPADNPYILADKVREALDRKACPDAFMRIAYESIIKNYTTPQQRPWVGLTDEEIKAVNAQVSQIPPIDYTTTTYAKAIEAKLKEKNT